jgi:hypothetical protein
MAGEIVTVTIDDASGNFEILVKNTREDLLHDLQYFLGEASVVSQADRLLLSAV